MKKSEPKKPQEWTEEERQNVVGLFELLLKVDNRQRILQKQLLILEHI